MAALAPAAVSDVWRVRGRELPLGPIPLLMGVINVTPDSFSDGGAFLDVDRAIDRGRALAAAGAAILDVGGESTRPGAEPVLLESELERTVPVIEGLARATDAVLSIDTTKLEVARAAIEAGAAIVNDVSALRFAPGIAALAAETGAGLVLMHMKGDPRTMQADPRYDDVVGEIAAELGVPWAAMHVQGEPATMQDDPRYGDVVQEVLAELVGRADAARAAGVPEVWIDPGIGFGKTHAHNLALLGRLDELVATGHPVVVGTSRKGFLGTLLGRSDGSEQPAPVDDRLEGSLATATWAMACGVRMVRAHDVWATVRAAEVIGGHINESRAA